LVVIVGGVVGGDAVGGVSRFVLFGKGGKEFGLRDCTLSFRDPLRKLDKERLTMDEQCRSLLEQGTMKDGTLW
jgi:hypothetical protein